MKTARKALIVAVIVVCFSTLLCALVFTTAEVPSVLLRPDQSTGQMFDTSNRALVLKWLRRNSLKQGDLVLVARHDGAKETREIQRLEKIEPPDESQRARVPDGRRPRSRAVAQAILDFDYTPKYWVSNGDTNAAVTTRVPEPDIKGKVVWIKAQRK